MICTKCGVDAGDFSYCPNCGEEVLSEVVCLNCGADVKDSNFCPNCGTNVKKWNTVLPVVRNEYIHEDKPMEDVNELILKIIDTPSKKLRVVKEDA